MPEADQVAALLVPQGEAEAPQALEEPEPGDVLEVGNLGHAPAQAVVGDLARQVVDVVVADVAGEPVGDGRPAARRPRA